MKIAIVTDDVEVARSLDEEIRLAGEEAWIAPGFDAALAAEPDLMFLAWTIPEALPEVLDAIRRTVESPKTVSVVVLTSAAGSVAAGRIQTAGAADILFLPPDGDEIRAEIEDLRSPGGGDPDERKRFREITETNLVGESRNFRECLEQIRQAARCDANVLLTGETGTGKEMAARAIHQLGKRSGQRYVAVNCVGLPRDLLESELFGHVPGAFTDAKDGRVGRFEYVGAGTLLLDEIGDMPLPLQMKLLRVIEQRSFQPVGSNEDVPFHGRLVSATSIWLERAVEEGRFRQDLLGRINQFRIHLPALRERPVDKAILVRHFLQEHSRGRGVSLSRTALEILEDFHFPMNVRQLENAVIGALARSDPGSVILPKHLPDEITNSRDPEPNAGDRGGGDSGAASEDVPGSAGETALPEFLTIRIPKDLSYTTARAYAERAVDEIYLRDLLSRHGGKVLPAAKEAGVDRDTFSKRLESLDATKGESSED